MIENYEKQYPLLKEKLIIFIIHLQRKIKDEKKNQLKTIPLINSNYGQFFIDNLKGNNNYNFILKIIDINNNDWAKDYLIESNFIDKQLCEVLNYINFTSFFENEELNNKNIKEQIMTKLQKNDELKKLLLNNLIMNGKRLKSSKKSLFQKSDKNVEKFEDFFEYIDNTFKTYFSKFFLGIIYYLLKANILIPLINNYEIFVGNDSFNHLIKNEFEKESFGSTLKMKLNSNKLMVYTNLKIPKSQLYLSKLLKYVKDEISSRYLKIEGELRKKLPSGKIKTIELKYSKEINLYVENLKNKINEIEIFKALYENENIELETFLLEDYSNYIIIKYFEKENTKNIGNEIFKKLINFIKIIIRLKLGDFCYKFNYSLDEFAKILLFTKSYEEDIGNFLKIFYKISNYCDNLEERIVSILNNNIIRYEISTRNKQYTEKVNKIFLYIIESFIRSLLIFSLELTKKNKKIILDFFSYFNLVEGIFNKINTKYTLFSKEIINIEILNKIKESCASNYEQFEDNYEKITNNLLKQSELLYKCDNITQLYDNIIELITIINSLFIEKNNNFTELLFFIIQKQMMITNLYPDDLLKIKLIQFVLKNNLILKKSKIFFSFFLKDMKPEIYNSKKETKKNYINNFMNLENNRLIKFRDLIKTCNDNESSLFNEVLLYFFEGLCQSYFLEILENHKNKYSTECCEELLLNTSLIYLSKAINFLDEKINNKILKLNVIAYIKTYCYYFVEINYNYFDNCRFDEIIILLDQKHDILTRNMIFLYIWRLYYRKFDSFERFINFDFSKKYLPFFRELREKLEKEKKNSTKYSFINKKSLKNYDKLSDKLEKMINNLPDKFVIDYINNDFDLFYSILVNKYISFIYFEEKKYSKLMKQIYNSTYKYIKLGNEGNILFNYIMNYDLFKKKIVEKISENNLSQEDFEILLYSLRFILNTQIQNEKCFYNALLKKNSKNLITSNFIPGSFPIETEYEKSYKILKKELPKKKNIGYYICKYCGYLYEVLPPTFPMMTYNCPNGHVIGGNNHICFKRDLRIFETQEDYDKLVAKYRQPSWINSFEKVLIKDFQKNYVDNNKQIDKGINRDYDINNFESVSSVRNMHKITYRLLNYILYSYLMGSYILNNLNKDDMREYLIENLFPHTPFGVIKKNWEFLSDYLKEIGIGKVQIFINVIFEKVIELMLKYNSFDKEDKMLLFEKEVNDYILEKISKDKSIDNLNTQYKIWNDSVLKINQFSYKEMIISNNDPSIYDKKQYPDIQYYTVSYVENMEKFIKKFYSNKENERKYALINSLLKKDEELIENAMNMKVLNNFNELSNILLTKYSYKIDRNYAKNTLFKNELEDINSFYFEMNGQDLNIKYFNEKVFNNFINSWDLIKKKCTKYKCRELCDENNPLNMNENLTLNYFLIDDLEKNGGMFLASAYEKMIRWQNDFLDIIIEKNKKEGILNEYISQLEQEINIQEAKPDEILNIDENIYEKFKKLIFIGSMRNIVIKDNTINYKNYNDIIYDFDYIEKELGKLILTGKKKFTEKITFIKYLYEGFIGSNSLIISDYTNKYGKRELNENEKKLLFELIRTNNKYKFYSEVYSSLQILIDKILKENYNPNELIYKIINTLPNYIIIKKELEEFFKSNSEMDGELFSIDCLISVFEIFEALCWKEISGKIPLDYKIILPIETQQRIIKYFEEDHNGEKLINNNNLTSSLRKFISRYLPCDFKEVVLKSDVKLELFIIKDEFWNQHLIDSDKLYEEISEIMKGEIEVGQAFDLYNILDGDKLLDMKVKEIFREYCSPQEDHSNGHFSYTNKLRDSV